MTDAVTIMQASTDSCAPMVRSPPTGDNMPWHVLSIDPSIINRDALLVGGG